MAAQTQFIKLPIDHYLDKINSILLNNNQLIIAAEPGAGKTTRVPPSLISVTDKKIIILEPRRIAARSSCERIAEEQNWTVGKEIGYQVKLENKTSPETKIIFITEALLWKKLQHDPSLSDVGILIFDEFHERNIYSDVSLSLATELQTLERSDLKLVMMSATLNIEQLQCYWPHSPLIKVPGLTFPCAILYDSKSQTLRTDYLFIDKMVQKIKLVTENKIMSDSENHILVFLPGTSEIRRIKEKLESDLFFKNILIFELHGQIEFEEQKKVLISKVNKPFLFKIILTTNIAESSLTVDDVDTVIDSGLAREWALDNKRFYPVLKTQRIAKASAIQRQGRSARQKNGFCYKMWTEQEEKTFIDFSSPEILKIDLTETVLFLNTMGITNPNNFSWFEAPSVKQIDTAISQLIERGLIDEKLIITNLGKAVSKNNLPLDLSLLFCKFIENNEIIWGAQIVSILSEKDYWRNQDLSSLASLNFDSDIAIRLHELNEDKNKKYFTSLHNFADKLCRSSHTKYCLKPLTDINDADTIHKIIFDGLSFNLSRRRKPKTLMAIHLSGMGVELATRSQVQHCEFFITLSGRSLEGASQSIVDFATPVKKEWVLGKFDSVIRLQKKIEYDESKNQFFKLEQKWLQNMPIEDELKKQCSPDEISLVDVLKNMWQSIKHKNDSLSQLIKRYQWAQKIYPQYSWPVWDEKLDQQIIELSLLGETNLKFIEDKNWEDVLMIVLDNYQIEENLDNKKLLLSKIIKSEFPSLITAPNQKKFKLEYTDDCVNLSFKIQDAFGWKSTPLIANGKITLRLILLGPHMRPIQTTNDLASFWNTAYKQMRPTLKADYPKHKWPEDPTIL